MEKNFNRRKILLGGGSAVLAGVLSKNFGSEKFAIANDSESFNIKDSVGSGSSSKGSIDFLSRAIRYPQKVYYGSDKNQYGDLFLPIQLTHKVPLIIVLHGGGWNSKTNLVYTVPMCLDLASRGFAVWNLEYRVNGTNGGWPNTFKDIDAAIRIIPTRLQRTAQGWIDLKNINILGHSAGGQLAAWAISRKLIKSKVLGLAPNVAFNTALLLAPVLDLVDAIKYGKDRYLKDFLGGTPDEIPHIYRLTSPINYLPTGVATICVHGTADTIVSYKQSVKYVQAAVKKHDNAKLILLPGADHNVFINVLGVEWGQARKLFLASIKRPRLNWN